VVWLQHRVRELEEELARVENEDSAEDPEAMMRAATVRVSEAKESKFLGASSGIAITRLVMQLAKQFTDARSIKDIVPEHQARHIKELFNQEQAKPSSKIYPLISDVAAVDLPNRALAKLLVELYSLKVQPLYPALHEPTLEKDVEDLYTLGEAATPYQQFVCRMVIAISLQKMDTQYAGLADSYYLAALAYLEPVVKAMDLKTLQCFALMAEYSLVTPTRTAIYYIIGIAVRLIQVLGFHEEKTITRPRADGVIDPLEIDMRRRLFWCIVVMDYGLAHSLGRPAMLATHQDHLDVKWFELCDDKFIRPEGIDPAAPRPSIKKWIAMHFFKMRMLQLEIRRKLYLRKRPEPRSDTDGWFLYMDAKLAAWRDASPSQDNDIGLDKAWFLGRYNTMVVFLYRPSPQIPRPSLDAALRCFEACRYNISMHQSQIERKNVDVTWIFTQTVFMAINTMLWSLSYEEVRKRHNREEVEGHLMIAMRAIQFASERWPGVASAIQLYQSLMEAILKIYEKDGDVPISAATPSEAAASPGATFPETFSRSRGASPATVASSSVATPPERQAPPFGYIDHQYNRPVTQSGNIQQQQSVNTTTPANAYGQQTPAVAPTNRTATQSSGNVPTLQTFQNTGVHQAQQATPSYYDPYTHFNPLPQFTPDLTVPGWTAAGPVQSQFASVGPDNLYNQFNDYSNHAAFNPNNPAYPFPATFENNTGMNDLMQQQDYWGMDTGEFETGLNQAQQEQLMRDLETDGMQDIQSMISSTLAAITPKPAQNPTFQ
jgi:hypothetical protein